MYDNSTMQKEIPNPITTIRSVKRNDLMDLRNKQREIALCHRRLGLQEVSGHTQNVTLLQFKELLLNLRKKTTVLDNLRKIKNSCVSYEYIETFFRNDGAFSCLISFLIGNDVQKQLEAATCLTNLICGSHKCSQKIAKASGVYLVSFISGNNYSLQDQSAWALGNIANDCNECFNIIKAQGVLLALYKALESPKPTVIQSIVFALNACTKYEDSEIISMIQLGLPKTLSHLLEQDNLHKSIFLDAAFALSNCCFWTIKYSLDNVDMEAIEKYIIILHKIIKTPDIEIMVSIPLIRCLGFLSYNDEVCEYISTHPSFYKSVKVIIEAKDCFFLKKELIWVLSNVAASQTTFCADLYMSLMDCVSPILKLENSATLQVLYYLCLALKDTCITRSLKQHEIFTQIQLLSSSERSDISNACKVFLKIIQCE